MRIGLLTIEIFMSENHSLKEKRAILKSLKSRLRNNFNISLIESDDYDKWQKATLSIAILGIKGATIDSCFSNIVDFLERNKQVELIDYKMEII